MKFIVMNINHKRQGQMDIASCYFYTNTIHDFKHLLKDDQFKTICINSLKYLVDNELIKIYGFVIMPNDIHLLWNMIKLNRKESPAGSFAKYTAHLLKKLLAKNDLNYLESFVYIRQIENTNFGKEILWQYNLPMKRIFYKS